MRVHIASDHAGFELKARLGEALRAKGYEVVDHGASALDPLDDYPAFCIACGQAVVADPGSLGVVIGGSGNGEQIAANKVPGVRAALAWNESTATLARKHNDANVVSIGAREHDAQTAIRLVEAFLRTDFTRAERHRRRIRQIADYEASRTAQTTA